MLISSSPSFTPRQPYPARQESNAAAAEPGAKADVKATQESRAAAPNSGKRPEADSGNPAQPSDQTLTEAEQSVVRELKARDVEVRAHESAHLSAAGSFATGGPSFTYQRGPDGVNYSIGGEVGIDTSPVPGDPQATLEKARTIRAAALAPANPSGQDRAVAADASRMAAQAQAEIIAAAQQEQESIRNSQQQDEARAAKGISVYQQINRNQEPAPTINQMA
ncbi:MAG: hypothetical protein GXP10_06070 [Gammaproteobacteria bacterium]|nr:hypothetical protein [Gammaproteobacteria bacterium]